MCLPVCICLYIDKNKTWQVCNSRYLACYHMCLSVCICLYIDKNKTRQVCNYRHLTSYHMCLSVCICLYIKCMCAFRCVCIGMLESMYVCMHVHMSVCLYTYMYVGMSLYVFTHTHTHTYIHTYIHMLQEITLFTYENVWALCVPWVSVEGMYIYDVVICICTHICADIQPRTHE